MLKFLKFTIIFGIFGLLVFSGMMLGFKLFLKKPVVTVPSVEKLQKREAIRTIRKAGLRYRLNYQDNIKERKDKVLFQTPDPGSKVKKGRIVDIYLSRGFGSIPVPDITNLDFYNAELALEEAGLKVGMQVKIKTNYVSKGIIVAQDPEPGTNVEKGTRINLIINQGPENKLIYVNNFVGQRIEFIGDLKNKFPLKIENEINTETFGIIIDQSIPMGSIVFEDTGLTFDYNAEIRDTGSYPIISTPPEVEVIRDLRYIYFNVPSGFIQRTLDVIIVDETGKEVIFHGKVRPGSKFEKIIHSSGSGLIYFYLDGKLEDYKRL